MIKLSVIVPTYNHVDFIEKCIEGIIKQKTDFKFEILIGDDESSDGTTQIIEKYEKLDSRIKLLKSTRENVIYVDGEPTGRFNWINLLRNSKGKYIALCDGDDYWIDEYKLQKQVDFLENNEDFAICFTNNLIEVDRTLKENNINLNGRNIFDVEDLVKNNFMHTTTVVIRNDFDYNNLPKWFYEVKIGDWSLYNIILNNRKIKYLDDVTAVYRIHEQGVFSLKPKGYKMIQYYKMLNIINSHFNYKYDYIIRGILNDIINYIDEGINAKKILDENPFCSKTDIKNYLKKEEEKLYNYIVDRIQGDNIYIWGAGTHTINLLDFLKSKSFNMDSIINIIDNDINKKGLLLKNKIIIYKSEFFEQLPQNCSDIIISSASYEEEIYNEIKIKLQNKVNIITLYKDNQNKFKVLL